MGNLCLFQAHSTVAEARRGRYEGQALCHSCGVRRRRCGPWCHAGRRHVAVRTTSTLNGDANLSHHGAAVNVPIRYLCPKDQNPNVVVDVSVTQEDKAGKTIEGKAESVALNCNDHWMSRTITVSRDATQSTGAAFIRGKATVKAVGLARPLMWCTGTAGLS